MHYKEIVKKAWDITHMDDSKELFPFGFIPSLFGMIIGVIYVSYQITAFRHSPLFSTDSGIDYFAILGPIWGFMQDHPSMAVALVLFAFFVFLMYVFSPVICGGALIDLLTKKLTEKKMRGGFSKGLASFFPLFEFAAITAPFGITTYFTEVSMVLRNFGTGTWLFVIPVLTIIFVLGIFLTLLFIFSEQYIVLEKENVINAMKRSAFLVLSNVKDTFFLGITMALIAARIFVNILLILLIPIVFVTIVAFMASVALKWLGIVLGTLIGVGILVGGAYLLAGFTIFTYAVWTITFIHFRKIEIENQQNEGYDDYIEAA